MKETDQWITKTDETDKPKVFYTLKVIRDSETDKSKDVEDTKAKFQKEREESSTFFDTEVDKFHDVRRN